VAKKRKKREAMLRKQTGFRRVPITFVLHLPGRGRGALAIDDMVSKEREKKVSS